MNEKAFANMKRERRRMIWRRLLKNKTAVAGGIFLILMVIIALTADLYLDYETDALSMSRNRLLGPSLEHPFGTDTLGRDIFARTVYGARVSLSTGIALAVFDLLAGVIIGSIAAFFGGKVDSVIMRICDTVICIPPMLLALAIVAVLGINLINLMIALTIGTVPSMAKMARAIMLNTVQRDFIEAAKAGGMKDFPIIYYHVIPNAIGPIIVEGTMSIASAILSVSALSFLGMGVQPPTPEWGSMLASELPHMRNYPHLVIVPGLAILLTTLSFNLLGDGLRDALDPALKD